MAVSVLVKMITFIDINVLPTAVVNTVLWHDGACPGPLVVRRIAEYQVAKRVIGHRPDLTSATVGVAWGEDAVHGGGGWSVARFFRALVPSLQVCTGL